MSKSLRRRLFYCSILVFVLLSGAILTYAFGLEYDWSDHRFIKTGSLILKTEPETEVYLNNRLLGEAALFNGVFAERRLVPGEYSLRLRKENYRSWQKLIEIKEGLIAEFAKAVLVKEKPQSQTLLNSATLFSDPPSLEETIIPIRQSKYLFFYDLVKKETVFSPDENDFSLQGLKLIWNGREQQGFFYGPKEKFWLADVRQKKLTKIGAVPSYFLNEKTVLVGNHLYASVWKNSQLNLESFDLLSGQNDLEAEAISSFYFDGGDLIFLSDSGQTLYRLRLSNHSWRPLVSLPFLSMGKILDWREAADSSFLLFNDQLWQIVGQQAELLVNGVKKIAVSPDGTLLAWLTDHEVWLMSLQDDFNQPVRLVGEREMILRLSDRLEDLAWQKDGRHLFLKTSERLVLTEADTRGGLNWYTLFNITSPGEKFWYNVVSDQLFHWADSSVYSLKYR